MQQIRAVDVTLEIGQTSEAVDVVAITATVETTSATISQTIENRRLVDLPLNGRNPFSLATLAPGVIPSFNNTGSSPFISGGRNATSEVTIDYSWSDEANRPFNSFGNPASSSGGDGSTSTRTHSLPMDHNYVVTPTFLVNSSRHVNSVSPMRNGRSGIRTSPARPRVSPWRRCCLACPTRAR